MIPFTGLFSTCFLALIVFENPAAGQAMVEYGVAAGATATSTTPARGLKDSIGGVLNSLDKTLKSTQAQPESQGQSSGTIQPDAPLTPKRKTAARVRPAPAAPPGNVASAPPPPPPPNYEDPTAIEAGIGYEELLRRFGPPALQFTYGPDRKSMSYLSKSGAIQVVFQGGKVTTAEKPN